MLANDPRTKPFKTAGDVCPPFESDDHEGERGSDPAGFFWGIFSVACKLEPGINSNQTPKSSSERTWNKLCMRHFTADCWTDFPVYFPSFSFIFEPAEGHVLKHGINQH